MMLIIIFFLVDFIISFEILRPSIVSVLPLHSNYFLRAAGATVAISLSSYRADHFQFLPNHFVQSQHKVKLGAGVTVRVF
jgi:hypothetical protein